jgi:hypothetical protein
MDQSGIEYLVKSGLAPKSIGGGRRRPRLFTDQGIAHFALVSALSQAGVELTPAGRVAMAVAADFEFSDGQIPDRLDDYWRDCAFESGDQFYLDREQTDTKDRFEFYKLINKHNQSRTHLIASPDEIVLEVINREFVFSGRANLKSVALFSNKSFDLVALARMTGWERGAKSVSLIPLHDEATADPYGARHLEDAYHEARQKAVSAIRINVSFAVRLAFERLRKHLEQPREVLA